MTVIVLSGRDLTQLDPLRLRLSAAETNPNNGCV